jgi:hypothetical protein
MAACTSEIDPGTAPAMLTGVQGYAGYGVPGDQFGGNFLRSPTGNVVTLQLDNLLIKWWSRRDLGASGWMQVLDQAYRHTSEREA